MVSDEALDIVTPSYQRGRDSFRTTQGAQCGGCQFYRCFFLRFEPSTPEDHGKVTFLDSVAPRHGSEQSSAMAT
jgi:hypothetical protein